MKRVFICSPYRGDIERNTAIARDLCHKACLIGYAPIAPHLIYPQFLNDDIPSQREQGIECGLSWLQVCDVVWVWTQDGITRGMSCELQAAEMLGKRIVYLNTMEDES